MLQPVLAQTPIDQGSSTRLSRPGSAHAIPHSNAYAQEAPQFIPDDQVASAGCGCPAETPTRARNALMSGSSFACRAAGSAGSPLHGCRRPDRRPSRWPDPPGSRPACIDRPRLRTGPSTRAGSCPRLVLRMRTDARRGPACGQALLPETASLPTFPVNPACSSANAPASPRPATRSPSPGSAGRRSR